MWTPTDLTHFTTGHELNATWVAVSSGLTRFETYLYYEVPMGWLVIVGYKPHLLMKLYDASGVEATKGRLLIGVLKPNRQLVQAWNEFNDYKTYKALSWTQQLNRDYHDNVEVDTGYGFCLCLEGWKISFQIYDTDVNLPATPHAATRIKMQVHFAEAADVLRALAKSREAGHQGLPDYLKRLMMR